ncbi:hypothetical protein QFC24_005334 [Naganishia onofrii]|uniref:Uncharacterized protein n=1 Tax=Naganishia onofrii TaxID=1851511 RepID=A0ACC2XCA8_9TREE|nr:hypothetical protein QFC24_005334 [Naganishia onofrii]
MSTFPRNLSSPSSDSLLLFPSSSSSTPARYTTDNTLLTRGRSRARPIHLVRQALGIPHFGIASGVVAPLNNGGGRRVKQPAEGRGKGGFQGTGRAGAALGLHLGSDEGGVKLGGDVKALKPILSRLPVVASSTLITNDHTSSNTSSPDALSIELLEEADVYYTQARLPYLSDDDTYLWGSLHGFQPTRNDYGAAFKRVADEAAQTIREARLVHPDLDDLPRLLDEEERPTGNMRPALKCPGFAKQASAYVSLIQQAFNWPLLPPLPLQMVGKYYGVLFRSTRHPQHRRQPPSTLNSSSSGDDSSNASTRLYAADREAHEEAVQSGGLLMYWYGEPDVQGNNVATCIWTGRDAATRASRLQRHRLAAGLAGQVYESYELVRYCVVKAAGETGLRIEACEE